MSRIDEIEKLMTENACCAGCPWLDVEDLKWLLETVRTQERVIREGLDQVLRLTDPY